MTKKLVIFDCDGVLVDSEYLSCKVFAKALLKYGYAISVDECVRKFTGVNEHMCREIIMKESGLDIPIDFWARERPALQEAFESEGTALMQPVLNMLDLHHISRCVASNSVKEHVVHCLETTNQLKYFQDQAIFTASQVKNAKPAPDLFLHAAEKMGVRPEDCIVVEDSHIGAKAAIAAGMQVFMFMGASHARFDWYHAQIAAYGKPMIACADELSHVIRNHFAIN